MQNVRRKQGRPNRHWKKCLILIPLAAAAVVAVLLVLNPTKENIRVYETDPAVRRTLVNRKTEDVVRVEVTMDEENSWAATQVEEGRLWEDAGFFLDSKVAGRVLEAASSMETEDTISEEPDILAHSEDFGLDHPSVSVRVEYTDGTEIGFSVGDHSPDADEGWYYMAVKGMDGLYALDTGTVEQWKMGRKTLHTLIQPDIQSSRIDHIRLEGRGETSEWVLDGTVMDENASDHWRIVQPFSYSADGTLMRSFLESLGSLRMGTYVSEATPENLQEHGLDEPYARLYVHLAAGMITQTSETGEARVVEADEADVEILFARPERESQFIVYAAFDGQICRVSTLTSGRVYDRRAGDTASRYLVSTAAENVAMLRISRNDMVDDYRVTPVPMLDGDGTPAVDASGNENPAMHCTWNGTEISYDAFLARYMPLQNARVSGSVPESYVPRGKEHTVIEIEDFTGRSETIRLYDYDSLHDAVRLNDDPILFYLVKNGLGL